MNSGEMLSVTRELLREAYRVQLSEKKSTTEAQRQEGIPNRDLTAHGESFKPSVASVNSMFSKSFFLGFPLCLRVSVVD